MDVLICRLGVGGCSTVGNNSADGTVRKAGWVGFSGGCVGCCTSELLLRLSHHGQRLAVDLALPGSCLISKQPHAAVFTWSFQSFLACEAGGSSWNEVGVEEHAAVLAWQAK